MKTPNDIPVGTGKVATFNGRKAAVFNDNGTLKAFSPLCPHEACTVEWDSAEADWHCPCHGSRFAGDGALKQGPAERGLDPLEGERKGQ